MSKAKITVIENGPLRAQHVKKLVAWKGEELPCTDEMVLCRCGESENKPYCDGAHKNHGFTGENTEKHIRNITIAYQGKEITIYDNRNICSHIGYCTAELPTVFTNKNPWIDPDGDTVEKIIAICDKCPSGALSYECKDGERSFGQEDDTPTIQLVGRHERYHGPYHITGRVKIEGQLSRSPESQIKAALCRCGRSKNKPYCNGDHRFIRSEDNQKEEAKGIPNGKGGGGKYD